MKTITYNPETHVLVPRDLIADAKQIFCSDVEPNTNGDCLDVIEWFNAMMAVAPQPEPVESCDTCKNNGGTRGECQNESCAYEPKTKPVDDFTTPQLNRVAELEAALREAKDALSKIEHLENDNGTIMSAGNCSSVATEAIAKINEVLK